jgi:hypothetical protein
MELLLRAQRSSFASLLLVFVFGSLIHVSCASFSPVSSGWEQPVVFAEIGDVMPVWQAFSHNIGYIHGKIRSPGVEFWALQIDLAAPEIEIVVKGGVMEGNLSLSTRVTSFVRDNGLIAGINAVPFDISTSKEGQPLKNMGIVISGGELITPANPHYDALVFYKPDSGYPRAEIVNQSSIHSTENMENAVGAFHHILKNGEPAERTFTRERRYPRSAAGISANGRYLYLLVIDGRRAASKGATEKETAQLLYALGSWEGLNLDGGGSSTLALRYPDGRVRAANTPVHGGIPGRERAVAGSLGIRLNTAD